MKARISNNQNSEMVNDEQVADYLRHNRDFFKQHLDLLSELNIPHDVAVPSLLERQVQTLRQQRQSLSTKIEHLISNARENESLSEEMHQFLLALLDAYTLDDVFIVIDHYLRMEFAADAVAIRLVDTYMDETEQENNVVSLLEYNQTSALENILLAGGPTCGQLPKEILYYLFGDEAADIESTAVVPIIDNHGTVYGIIAIGSSDGQRYQADMGTIFLRRLGEVTAHIIKQFIREDDEQE
jgi:uncharacterized protein YigA (DUF484 family)